uniref:Uncharacterized protein n=1 Tax=Arundo donax TaxID=35708 RepID=A0A0A8ZV61_ARUDO
MHDLCVSLNKHEGFQNKLHGKIKHKTCTERVPLWDPNSIFFLLNCVSFFTDPNVVSNSARPPGWAIFVQRFLSQKKCPEINRMLLMASQLRYPWANEQLNSMVKPSLYATALRVLYGPRFLQPNY